MQLKRKSAFLLLTVMFALAAVLSACGGNNGGNAAGNDAPAGENAAANGAGENASGELEEVTLKMILVGGRPIDYDQVFGELNKKLKERINATVEVEFLDWSDWTQKYPLKFAASHPIHLCCP